MTMIDSARKAKTYASRHLDVVNWIDVSSLTVQRGSLLWICFQGLGYL